MPAIDLPDFAKIVGENEMTAPDSLLPDEIEQMRYEAKNLIDGICKTFDFQDDTTRRVNYFNMQCLQKIMDRLMESPAPVEWREIESAPKDGSKILAYCTNGGDPFCEVLYWDSTDDNQAEKPSWISGYFDSHYEQNYTYTVTHWQPLPPPPKMEK